MKSPEIYTTRAKNLSLSTAIFQFCSTLHRLGSQAQGVKEPKNCEEVILDEDRLKITKESSLFLADDSDNEKQ